MTPRIDEIRGLGILCVASGGWLVAIALCMLVPSFGQIALIASGASALLNVVPTYYVWRGRSDGLARIIGAATAAIQPSLLVYTMQGSSWQIDTHLYFFPALVAVAMLIDARALVLSCAIIIAQHTVLAIAAPDWVFWGGGGMARVSLHAVAVIMTGSLLCWVSLALRNALMATEEERASNEDLVKQLEETAQSLDNAFTQIKAERAANKRTQAEAERHRQAEYASFAEDFEQSVSAVTQSVSAVTLLLEETAHSLTGLATSAGAEAREVIGSAESASKAVHTVARGVAELSSSIASVSVDVSQQTELTARATRKSGSGGEAVGSLTEQSKTIGEATRSIVRIAERTNLLSLNAAIEAATAGASGRGFTIVAQEVKALANQAGQAATQIDSFLSGVRTGTDEAERSFTAIEEAVSKLDRSATSIRDAVEDQRQSADAIEHFARNAADEVDQMVSRSHGLAERATQAKAVLLQLDSVAADLSENVRQLESSATDFSRRLREK